MKYILAAITCLLLSGVPAVQAGLDSELLAVQHQWAVVNYDTPKAAQEKAFDELTARARKLVGDNPDRAEPLVWLAIVLSSDAGATGGIGALGKVKEARRHLEAAEQIDAGVLGGSVYTSLGSLYYQVPGWPIGFGNDDKAEVYLKKALAVNPDGIDPNYFYGDFMLEEGKPKVAIQYFEKAQAAPPRPDRPRADSGRQLEIASKLAEARSRLDH